MPVYFSDLKIGQTYTSQGRAVTEADIRSFAGLSGDFNPLHTNDVWVQNNTDFKGRIAHGLLILAMSSGMRTPVIDDLNVLAFLEVSRRMIAPVYPGDTVTIKQTVEDLRESRSRPGAGIVTLGIQAITQSDTLVQAGVDKLLIGASE